MNPCAVLIVQFHFSVVIGSQLADQQAAARCRLWHFSDVTAQADDVSPLGLFRCEHRDLILTRSAYDHKRMRPLKPMVGVVKSLGYYRRGPVVLVRKQKVRAQYKKPTEPRKWELIQKAIVRRTRCQTMPPYP
jgi:hypothetical protein